MNHNNNNIIDVPCLDMQMDPSMSSPNYNFSPNYYSYDVHMDMSMDSPHQERRSNKMRGSNRQRQAANERERRRMNSINQGFDTLRCRLPSSPLDKKLSKVDTLRNAMKYIQELKSLLEGQHEKDGNKKIIFENNGLENPPSIYMVSWRKVPEKYGAVHETKRGPVVFQKNVWVPEMEQTTNHNTSHNINDNHQSSHFLNE